MCPNDPYRCPYPGCDWETSRPADSDVRLTQVVVQYEIKKHRKSHAGEEPAGGDGGG